MAELKVDEAICPEGQYQVGSHIYRTNLAELCVMIASIVGEMILPRGELTITLRVSRVEFFHCFRQLVAHAIRHDSFLSFCFAMQPLSQAGAFVAFQNDEPEEACHWLRKAFRSHGTICSRGHGQRGSSSTAARPVQRECHHPRRAQINHLE